MWQQVHLNDHEKHSFYRKATRERRVGFRVWAILHLKQRANWTRKGELSPVKCGKDIYGIVVGFHAVAHCRMRDVAPSLPVSEETGVRCLWPFAAQQDP